MTNHFRRLRWLTALAVAGLAALAAASIGAGGTRAKSPITVMTIAPVQVQAGTPFENIFEAARIYGAWINARGGINGHPLKVILCDDKGDPNQATYCARQAVSKKVAAVVGAFSINDSRIIPVLQQANIAYFGTCCGFSNEDFTLPNSFPLGSQWALNLGFAAAAAKNCSRIGVVNYDVPGYKDILDKFYTGALAGYGKTIKAEAYVPLTAADLSPQVAQVTNGTDCIVLGITESQVIPFLGAMKQAGAHQRLFGLQGNIDAKACAHYWDLCNNAVVASVYPDESSPVWAAYRGALKTYHAKSGIDYDSLGGLGTWAAYVAFTNVVKKMSGAVTAPAFLNAAANTTRLSTGGLLPPLNFKYDWNVKGFDRMFNRTVAFSTVKNKTFVPYDNRFHDMTPAFFGKKAGL